MSPWGKRWAIGEVGAGDAKWFRWAVGNGVIGRWWNAGAWHPPFSGDRVEPRQVGLPGSGIDEVKRLVVSHRLKPPERDTVAHLWEP